MALKGKAENGKGDGGEYELLEADTYEGRLVAIIDVGEHDTKFGCKRQVVFVWELTNAPPRKDKKPWFVFDRWTLSRNNEATMRLALEAWRRKAYAEDEDIDPTKFLGQPWSVEITHKVDGKGIKRHRVGTVGPVPRNRVAEVKAPTVLPFSYDLDDETPVSRAELAKAMEWLPWVYGSKVTDLVAEGKRNLALAGGGGGNNGHAAEPGAAPKEEEIPF